MKRLVAVLLVPAVVALAVLLASPVTAQEAPTPEYTALEERVAALEATAQVSPLVLACQIGAAKAAHEGLALTYCRRAQPDEVNGNWVTIYAEVKIKGYGKFITTTYLVRSPYAIEGWKVAPLG